ncbi:hypothetical protein C3L33_00688, partial [Rhododendron williamsianum]
MQSTAIFLLSPSIPPRLSHRTTTWTLNPIPTPLHSRSLDFAASINGLSGSSSLCQFPVTRCCSSPSSSSSSYLNGWISTPPPVPVPDREPRGVEVRAAESCAGEEEDAKASGLNKTLELGSLFGLWFLFNIYFNIYNKQVLKVFPFPLTISTIQFAAGTILVTLMWTLNLYKRPKISGAQLAVILPLAMVHTLGNLFTNMSLGKVAVSFTHTIKAMEPFFSVVLSAMFLGEDSLDNITLFSIITIMSFILSAPISLYLEGFKFTPSCLQAVVSKSRMLQISSVALLGLNVRQVYIRSFLAALCFHAYQQVSYMILQRVSPVTHSVSNCVKRVVVIISSVLFFRTPVSPINSIGTIACP